MTNIDRYAFNGCSSLASVTFSSDSQLSNIGEQAFTSCSLTSINIPSTVVSVGQYAFAGNSGLQTAMIPSTLMGMIDWTIFYNSPVTVTTT